MLENLSSDTPAALKSCAEGWLVHSLHRGDVARLFDPIFLILLDPGCARIGVQKYFDELRMKEKTSRTDMDVEMTEMADLKEVDEVEEELGVEVDSDEDESEAKRRDMLKKSCSMPDLDKFSSGNVDEDDDASLIIATIVDELIRKVVDAESGTENTEAKSSVFKPGHRRQRSQSFSMIESVRSPSPASLFSENPSQSVLSLGERLHSLRPNDEPVAEDPLHSFLLVYDCVPDLAQVKYALTLMQAAVMTHPNSVLRGLVSTNLSSAHSPRANELQKLLARHKRSMRGLAFAGKLSGQEASSVQRGITLFEILVFSCLSFIRSCLAVGNDGCDVIWNSEVRLAAVDLLTVTFLETLDLVRANGRGFASFIVDMLLRCKVQKIVLRSLASSVDRVKKRLDSEEEQEEDCGTKWQIRASEMLLEFNEGGVDVDCGSGGTGRSFPEALQIHLLRLLHALLMLEHEVGVVQTVNPSSKVMDTEKWAKITFVAPTSSLRYMIGQPIPAQSIFLHSMLTVLRQEKLRHLHGAWLATVTASLPFLGRTLSQTALLLARQICFNLESIQNVVQEKEEERLSRGRRIPPDYVVRSLEALSSLCHFCLLDNAECSVLSGITGSHFQATASSLTNPTSSISRIGGGGSKPSSSHTTQIINNLINVFIPSVPLKVPESSRESRAAKDALESARKALLGVLPRIVVAMASLWSSACDLSCRDEYSWVLGHPRDVKHHVLEFISPIAVTHGTNFLVAAAVAWHDSKKRMKLAIPSESKNEAAKVGEEREKLVALITAIKSLPPDRVIHLVTQIVSSIPSSHSASTLIGIHSDWNRAVHFSSNSLGPVNSQAVENSVLELFVAYVERCPQQQLVESFPAVASLVKEALAVAALSQSSNSTLAFVTHECVAQVFNVLYAFVQRVPSSLEKRDQRELQDLSVRVLDLLGQSAGLCLEQTAWLRPRTVVKQDLQLIPNSSDYATDISKNATEEPPPEKVDIVDCPEYKPNKPEDTRVPVIGLKKGSERAIAEQCLCSLRLLADKVASFLDVTYASDEKERVVPILSSLLTNVTPYLRNHAKGNMLRHRACAQMLSAISSFPYARKAWKRDALDLFLDPAFFRMDLESLRHWKSLLDNLVAQEKLLFKDLLNRFPVGPSGSLNLFSSREAEAELRSLLLKRIAFLLFCSDSDQYQQFVPVLQEKLGECLRWSTVTSSGSAQTGPAVQAGVFLCFRVLLLRSSAPHLSALWPSIITELVQVLLQIEQDLSSDSEEFNSHLKRLSVLDTTFVTANGLLAHNHPAWLNLYLCACKLLDTALALPTNRLPQFQMYSWAFVGSLDQQETTDQQGKITAMLINGAPRTRAEENSREEVNGKLNECEDTVLGIEAERWQNENLNSSGSHFMPHVTRIARLMKSKFGMGNPNISSFLGEERSGLILTMKEVKSVEELAPFFFARGLQSGRVINRRPPVTPKTPKPESNSAVAQGEIEAIEQPVDLSCGNLTCEACLTNGCSYLTCQTGNQSDECAKTPGNDDQFCQWLKWSNSSSTSIGTLCFSVMTVSPDPDITTTLAPTTNGTSPVPPTTANITTTPSTTTTITTSPPTTSSSTTTEKPTTSSSAPPTPVPSSSTAAPNPDPSENPRHFDAPSFVGGMILALGLTSVGFMGFKFYQVRVSGNYHTL
ncbi:unnamed protein product [Notodromas monacha]|uniref:Uncharacterized protein n=1 Tax=Notodromas monacha TaxID=399045 RepID=A0A7R9BGN7_9CRUS|nr:unnamed protein product [Notodromas monacha]CAG0914055.1 unnamed protein product [Notodromas monacha]